MNNEEVVKYTLENEFGIVVTKPTLKELWESKQDNPDAIAYAYVDTGHGTRKLQITLERQDGRTKAYWAKGVGAKDLYKSKR